MKNFDDFSGEATIEKERKKEGINSKQNREGATIGVSIGHFDASSNQRDGPLSNGQTGRKQGKLPNFGNYSLNTLNLQPSGTKHRRFQSNDKMNNFFTKN
jgi:hypothetical protein